MPFNRLPNLDKCCGCVTDLKTAAAIIAVLGIVTSPSVSWAIIRHSYVIRVSCFVSTSTSRTDVVDINLNNIISFGFGANAGLSPSCLGTASTNTTSQARSVNIARTESTSSGFISAVKYIGWLVFTADVIFVFCSIRLLVTIFKGNVKKAAKLFMYSAAFSIILSFLYGMLYVSACISIGGAFPVFEFAFSIIDVITYFTWFYFLIVVQSYIRSTETPDWNYLSIFYFPLQDWFTVSNFMTTLAAYLFGYKIWSYINSANDIL